METLKRRGFIKKSMVVSAGLAIGAPAYIKGFVQTKPSDIINVAVVGVHSQGGFAMSNFTKIKDTRVVAICDCVETLLPAASAAIEKLGGAKPKTVVDYRDLLTDKGIDVISIATPGYWHALMTIAACQAGKDVYCEKPLAYTIEEGRKVVQAARKYNRIVQIGTQNRSNRIKQKAIQLIHEGVIGEVYMGRGIVFDHRGSIGGTENIPIPKGTNWDLFRGPAPMIPFSNNHYLYNWHWYWDTSTSEFGNNGIHMMDLVRWGMNKNEHPTKIACCGGFYAYDSDQEIPNLEVATFEYADGSMMELEVRSLFTNYEQGGSKDCFFYGSKGWMHIGNGFEIYLGTKKEPESVMTSKDLEPDEYDKLGIDHHFVNFIGAIRSRKYQDLIADVEGGHMSTAIMHLGNIAYRTDRKLTFDGKTERFVNDNDANTYLTRKDGYRKPYVLPEKI